MVNLCKPPVLNQMITCALLADDVTVKVLSQFVQIIIHVNRRSNLLAAKFSTLLFQTAFWLLKLKLNFRND